MQHGNESLTCGRSTYHGGQNGEGKCAQSRHDHNNQEAQPKRAEPQTEGAYPSPAGYHTNQVKAHQRNIQTHVLPNQQ